MQLVPSFPSLRIFTTALVHHCLPLSYKPISPVFTSLSHRATSASATTTGPTTRPAALWRLPTHLFTLLSTALSFERLCHRAGTAFRHPIKEPACDISHLSNPRYQLTLHQMPSVAEEPPFHGGTRANAQHSLSVPFKKRRWEDGSSSSDASGHSDDAVVSLFLHDDTELLSHKLAFAAGTTASAIRTSIGGSTASLRSLPSPQRKIIPLGSKRRRLSSCDSSNSADGCRPKSSKDSSNSATTHVASLMLPCHVCQRKPRRKSDLDSQADCEGCGQRACFVCLRECPGWAANGFRDDCGGQTPTQEASERGLCHFGMAPHQSSRKPSSRPWSVSSRGHRRIICSRCCVERGQDGEVVCLGCMAS